MKLIKKLFNDEAGSTLSEYALIGALIAVVSIVVLVTVGDQINGFFEQIACAFTNS